MRIQMGEKIHRTVTKSSWKWVFLFHLQPPLIFCNCYEFEISPATMTPTPKFVNGFLLILCSLMETCQRGMQDANVDLSFSMADFHFDHLALLLLPVTQSSVHIWTFLWLSWSTYLFWVNDSNTIKANSINSPTHRISSPCISFRLDFLKAVLLSLLED